MLLQSCLYNSKVGEYMVGVILIHLYDLLSNTSSWDAILESVCLIYSMIPDMWAMGAIMAELFSLRPLFPGARYVCHHLYQLLKGFFNFFFIIMRYITHKAAFNFCMQ